MSAGGGSAGTMCPVEGDKEPSSAPTPLTSKDSRNEEDPSARLDDSKASRALGGLLEASATTSSSAGSSSLGRPGLQRAYTLDGANSRTPTYPLLLALRVLGCDGSLN